MDDETVQDMHREDMHHMGAAELAVAQEGLYVVIVAVAGPGLVGTSACTVCLDMANLRLTRITCGHLRQ